MKRIFQLTQFTCILAWVTFGLPPIQAESLHSQSPSSSEQVKSLPASHDIDAPQTEPGGSRGCLDQPIALVTNQSGKTMGFTRQERPTFWVYLPYKEEQIVNNKIELRLRDSEGDTKYVTEFELNVENPRVLGIPLPSDAPPLALNQEYEWQVSVKVDCKKGTRYSIQGISAWAIRTDATNEIAEDGFIYDRLTAIAQSENPEERQQQWLQFLQSLNLGQNRETLTDKCCTILNPSTPISYQ